MMLQNLWRQLPKVLTESSLIPPLSGAVTRPRALVHTSTPTPSRDRDSDSVRQQGESVTPLSTDTLQYSHTAPAPNFTFPTLETLSESFDGVPFHQIPVIYVKATSNNTVISVTDGDGKTIAIQSAGTVGFRNARRGTNVAAQAAAIALADDAKRKDVTMARVCLRGIGPGRFPALKAIEVSGIKIVSITDNTRLAFNGNRPKKVRRL